MNDQSYFVLFALLVVLAVVLYTYLHAARKERDWYIKVLRGQTNHGKFLSSLAVYKVDVGPGEPELRVTLMPNGRLAKLYKRIPEE